MPEAITNPEAETGTTTAPQAAPETLQEDTVNAPETEVSAEDVDLDLDLDTDSEEDEFEDILSQFDGDPVEEEEVKDPPVVEGEEKKVEAAPIEDKVVEPTPETEIKPEATPPVEPQAPQTTAQPTAPAPAPQPAEDQESLQAAYKGWFDGMSKTAAGMYQLSEEEATALEEDPAKALPELAGKMHVQIFASAYAQIVNDLPRLLPQAIDMVQSSRDGVEEFWGEWPELKGHEAAVETAAAIVKQQNPNISRQEAVNKIGIMACLSQGIVTDKLRAMANPTQPATSEPAVQTPPPPSVAAGNPGATVSEPEPSIWSELVETHQKESN